MGALADKSRTSIAALLEVARACFGDQGYQKTSLEGVAAAARLTKGAVYHHFGSKLALFEAVFRREHQRMIELVIAKSRPAADPVDGLLRGVRAYLKALVDPRARRILLQDGPSALGWERWRRCGEPSVQQLMERSLAAAAERGMLRSGLRPAESALLLLGAITEAALTVAHSERPKATIRRVSQELASHIRALCS